MRARAGRARRGRTELGNNQSRSVETPHVHHWDSLMAFEETTRSCSRQICLSSPRSNPPSCMTIEQRDASVIPNLGLFASEKPVLSAVERLEMLTPTWVHPMHGGSRPSAVLSTYTQALRSEPFAIEGKLFGRCCLATRSAERLQRIHTCR